MTHAQRIAIANPALLAVECMHPRYRSLVGIYGRILTVNAGYEWLDAGFGGPVWHASISSRLVVPPSALFTEAAIALAGVGDPMLGEWREVGECAVHIRRRLTDAEAERVGPVRDIRGTIEARRRVQRVARYVPPHMRGVEQ